MTRISHRGESDLGLFNVTPPESVPGGADEVRHTSHFQVGCTGAHTTAGTSFPASRIPRAVSTFIRSSPPRAKKTMSAKIAGR